MYIFTRYINPLYVNLVEDALVYLGEYGLLYAWGVINLITGSLERDERN